MSLINLELLDDKKTIEEDNLIIGSGAGGSTIAYELLKSGKRSIILEEGPNIAENKKLNIGKSIVNYYRNNGATPIISSNGGPLIGYGQGFCVGGSTYVNAGYFSNTPEWIFNEWIKQGKTILEYKDFQKLLSEIKNELKVNVEELTHSDGDSKYLLDRSNKINWKIEKCERFSTGEVGAEKQTMNNSYHKHLLKNKIDIIHDCKVEKIIVQNGYAKSIKAMNKVNKKIYNFKFKNLFINCGPINTPHLLLKNRLIKFDNKVKDFEFHLNFKILVKFKKEINFNTSNEFNPDLPVSIFFMREFEKDGALLSAANSELSYMMATSSHFSDDIKKDIYLNNKNYAMFIYQIKSNSTGNIRNLLNSPIVSYEYNQKDNYEIKKGIQRTANFFLNEDVDHILYPIENSLPIRTIKDSNHLSENFNPKKLHLVSVHGMSSMRPGNDSKFHTNHHGKVNGYKNIYINDASILPGNTGESPQASIMAFAKFIAKNLKEN
jgi:hypothetical protein